MFKRREHLPRSWRRSETAPALDEAAARGAGELRVPMMGAHRTLRPAAAAKPSPSS